MIGLEIKLNELLLQASEKYVGKEAILIPQ